MSRWKSLTNVRILHNQSFPLLAYIIRYVYPFKNTSWTWFFSWSWIKCASNVSSYVLLNPFRPISPNDASCNVLGHSWETVACGPHWQPPVFIWSESEEWFLHVKWLKKIEKWYLYDLLKPFEIQISVSENKVILEHSHIHDTCSVTAFVPQQQQWVFETEIKPEPKNLKYLLSPPLQKELANPSKRGSGEKNP